MVATLACAVDPLPRNRCRHRSCPFTTGRALHLLRHRCLSLRHVDQIHAQILRHHLLPSLPTFSFNLLFRSLSASPGSPRRPLLLFTLLLRFSLPLDPFTLPLLFSSLSPSPPHSSAPSLHAFALKSSTLPSNLALQNSLLRLYFASGLPSSGLRLFRSVPSKNVVSWSAVIHAFARLRRPLHALHFFRQMQKHGVQPNEFTFVSLLLACADLRSLPLGRRVHRLAREHCSSEPPGVHLGTALINMYSKCGSLEDALEVFDEMPKRSTATWNSMISGLGVHVHGTEAVSRFAEMERARVRPDGVTFVGLLRACVGASMVDEARQLFRVMRERYGVEASSEHYRCMIELFGRAGMWAEAYELVANVGGERGVEVWKAFERVCERHGNVELAYFSNLRVARLESVLVTAADFKTQAKELKHG